MKNYFKIAAIALTMALPNAAAAAVVSPSDPAFFEFDFSNFDDRVITGFNLFCNGYECDTPTTTTGLFGIASLHVDFGEVEGDNSLGGETVYDFNIDALAGENYTLQNTINVASSVQTLFVTISSTTTTFVLDAIEVVTRAPGPAFFNTARVNTPNLVEELGGDALSAVPLPASFAFLGGALALVGFQRVGRRKV